MKGQKIFSYLYKNFYSKGLKVIAMTPSKHNKRFYTFLR